MYVEDFNDSKNTSLKILPEFTLILYISQSTDTKGIKIITHSILKCKYPFLSKLIPFYF